MAKKNDTEKWNLAPQKSSAAQFLTYVASTRRKFISAKHASASYVIYFLFGPDKLPQTGKEIVPCLS
ncbi:MAG: hypothetical protein J6Z49_03445 [Kiritimatiellae bacterium]|nr:hypothetical protein [Kiritimatiellia bacterium]